MQSYESLLNGDLNWALMEGSMHFEGVSVVHRTVRRKVHRLEHLGVDNSIAGEMNLFFRGYRRNGNSLAWGREGSSFAARVATRRAAHCCDLSNRGCLRLENCTPSRLAHEALNI